MVNERYLFSYLNREKPEFAKTVEALAAQKAYNSLPEELRLEYAVYSTSLDPIFFKTDLNWVEENLPPYPLIVKKYVEENLSKENLEELRKNPRKFKKLLAETLPKEWVEIQEEYSKQLWYDFRKLIIPTYILGIASTYLATGNPYSILYWASGIVPYYILKIFAYTTKNKKVSKYLDSTAAIYFFGRFGVSAMLSVIELSYLAPIIGRQLEKIWPYLPRKARKVIDLIEKWLSGIKLKEFDEKEIRNSLLEVPRVVRHKVPRKAFEKYLDELENGLIEIEDPRKLLYKPFVLSYHRRKAVVERRGIVDKDFVRKLAKVEGTFIEEMERRIERKPWKYLGVDLINGEIVWVRDIIGILSVKNEGLFLGSVRKEGYNCLLGKRADEIAKEIIVPISLRHWRQLKSM